MNTNNFISNIASNDTRNVKPEVGMGATMCAYTDRYAGTIIKVTPKTITVQEDKATRADKNGMSDSQDYTYEKDPNGQIVSFRFNVKRNVWRSAKMGYTLIIGTRMEYYDYSF